MEDQVDQFVSLLDQKQMTFEKMWGPGPFLKYPG